MGNGQVERFNQTLLQMLGTLDEYQKSDWKAHVPTLVHAYNATFHDSTGYSPYFLMFGRHPRLAVDAFLGLSPDTLSSPAQSEYVKKLSDRLHFAYQKAQEAAKKSAAVHKVRYDVNARNSVLKPGDRVLVKNVGVRGKCKLADRWEQDPYIVKAQPNPDIPVFEVQRENSRSKIRTLHRNLLLPFYGLPRFQEEDTQQQSDVSPAPQSINQSNTESDYDADSETSSDSKSVNTQVSRAFENPRLTEHIRNKKYVIPMRRQPGEPGVLPRSTAPSTNYTSLPSERADSSSDERSIYLRPSRSRRKPRWMLSDNWLLGQLQAYISKPD